MSCEIDMTKIVLLKLLLAVVITFILILPEYFKTPKGNTLELSCLEACLQPNLTYLFPLNVSFVTFLQPRRDNQTLLELCLNHSSFENITSLCQDITREFSMCFSCLVCESKENVNFMSQEQTSEVLVMRGSVKEKKNDFYSPCQHFNFTAPSILDYVEEYNLSCNPNTHTKIIIMEEESTEERSRNHSHRLEGYPNNCVHISLHLEVVAKNFICSMKITWYVLVLSVFMFLFILIIHKTLEGHKRMKKWQSHKYQSPSVLLEGSNSEKLRTLDVPVISGTMQRLSLTRVKEVLPQIPELEVASTEP